MKSIFFRYFRMAALLVLASTLTIGLGFMLFTLNYLEAEWREQLISHARSLQNYASLTFPRNPNSLFFPGQIQEFNSTISLVANVSGTHILLCDLQGNVYLQAGNAETEGRQTLSPAVIEDTLDRYSQSGELFIFQGTMDGYYTARQTTAVIPVRNENNQIFALFYLSMPVSNDGTLVGAFVSIFTYVSMVVAAVAAYSAYLLARRMNRPLRQMRDAVATFSLGDFSQRVPIQENRRDEIGELSNAFNTMADALAKAEELRRGFIANASHEMRTPMTNILGYIDGILDGTLPQDGTGQYLNIIRSEILRMSRLVKRMLDIAKLQSGEFDVNLQPVNLSELASQTLFSFEPKIEQKGLEVRAYFEDEAWCRADADAIGQVLNNLLDNAVKFSTGGTPLELCVYTKGGKVWFSVSNRGPDIPAEDLPYIFDRFHKADHSRARNPSGLGLGLYLVKTIVNGHSEHIYATSEDGVTTFTFSLMACKK